MGKDLSEIEDEYKTSYEEITDDFSKKVREGKDRSKARRDYRKKFHRILKKRNKAYTNYVKKHKQELLGMPEKKKKKSSKKGVYKAYHIDFEDSFLDKLNYFSKRFFFHLSLFFRKVRYNLIPSRIKFWVFRIGVFLKSIFSDVSLFVRGIRMNVSRYFSRIYEKIKGWMLNVFSKIKGVVSRIDEWNKKRIEKKKKAKEEKSLEKEKGKEDGKNSEENKEEEEKDGAK